MEPIWRKSYPAHIPYEVDPDSVGSLVNLIESAFAQYRSSPASHNRGTTLTYGDVDELSGCYAAWLQSRLQLKKGERIALVCPNILPFPVAMYGHLRAGLIQVNVNPLYTARELQHQLNDAQVQSVVLIESALPALQAILDKVPVKNAIVIGRDDLLGEADTATVPELPGIQACTFSSALAAGKKEDYTPVALNGDDLAFLQYTGGTTGLAKGAMLSHRNVITTVLAVNCLSFLYKGGLNILINNPRDMQAFLAELRKWPFTVITGVNTLFNAHLHAPGFAELDFSSLKLAMGGGTPIQESISNRWQAVTGKHIKAGYGMSETGGVTQTPTTMRGFRSTIGLPFPSLEPQRVFSGLSFGGAGDKMPLFVLYAPADCQDSGKGEPVYRGVEARIQCNT